MRPELEKYTEFKAVDANGIGGIALIDVYGDEARIVQAARTSYGKGTKSVRSDRALIRYLMRNAHTSPFEMVEMVFCIKICMDTWRQQIRHRTANVNEYSTRYSEALEEIATTSPGEWRLQSKTNKQGSSGEFLSLEQGEYLSGLEAEAIEACRRSYKEAVSAGVAKEQARRILPLGQYTLAYWKCDLHNLLHFLRLRLHPHAQREIREYAEYIGEIVAAAFPNVWEAFEDYRLDAYTLSALEIHALKIMLKTKKGVDELSSTPCMENFGKTELLEFKNFLIRIGLEI